jgi:hypothetical protein
MCHFYYEQNGLLGCIARQILCPPTVTRTYDKSHPGEYTSRVETVLPPRLSLRSFATYQTVVLVLVLMGLVWLLGYGPLSFFSVLLILWIFYVLPKAVLEAWSGSTRHSAIAATLPSPSPINYSDVSFSDM